MKRTKSKGFTWGELKSILNKMDNEHLKQDAIIMRNDAGIDGVVHTIEITKTDLMWDYGDDPSYLKKKTELTAEELEDYDLYIAKNSLVAHI